MKCYKVEFVGYHIVDAESPEEAVQKAADGEWYEEYIEHGDNPQEIGEGGEEE